MQFLRKLVEKQRALYLQPGSRLRKVWPLFDAFETFLFSPSTTAPKSGPHVRDYIDLKRTMTMVIYALVPCVLFSIWNTGYQHFLALASMPTDQAYVVGWLQGLFMGSDYNPDLANPGNRDIILFKVIISTFQDIKAGRIGRTVQTLQSK